MGDDIVIGGVKYGMHVVMRALAEKLRSADGERSEGMLVDDHLVTVVVKPISLEIGRAHV